MLPVLLAASVDTGTLLLVLLVLVGLVVLVLRGLRASRGAVPPDEPAVAPGPGVHAATHDAAGGPGSPASGSDAADEALPVERVAQDWRALDDPDREVEGEARPALEAVDVLVARLRGGDARTCERTVEALVRHGAAAVPALRAALDDPDPDLRVDARRALDRITGA